MPFIGLGVHFLVALFFAIHAVRTGQGIYWLFILFSFPLLGSVVYLLAVYLPNTRLEHGIRKATAAAARSLDPGRELRDAVQAFDLAPTAQNQMRVARAHLEAGSTMEAIHHFEACLQGPFASDPEMRLGAARARLAHGDGAEAAKLLLAIRKDSIDFRPERIALLLAQAHSLTGQNQRAREEFDSVVARFGTVEARAEYAIWALSIGDFDTARNLQTEIDRSVKHWDKNTRSLNKPLLKRLETAFATSRK